jgi:putative aldouronate transport system substrate-binding protein
MRKVSIVLLVVMLFALFGSGCSNVTSAPAAAPSESGNATQQQQSEPPTAETVNLNFLVNCNPATEDLNKNVFYQKMADQAGVKVNYECVYSDWDTKRTTRIASNDLPDAIAGYSAVPINEITKNVGLFADLSQYIDKDAPNIKATLEMDPDYKNQVTDLDGKIYFLSNRQPFRPSTWASLNINKEWLKAVGMKMPTTTDELVAVLEAFRDQDPNRNGQKDEIPFYMYLTGDEAWSINVFEGCFDCATSIANPFALVDGKLVFQPATDNYKKFLTWVAMLHSEKLMPDECATMDWSTFSARLGADTPIVGLTDCWVHDPINIKYQDQYETMPQIKGPDGFSYIGGNPFVSAHEPTPAFVMTVKNANPDKTMQFMDLFSKPENSIQAHYGPVGVNLTLENGKYTVNNPPSGMDWDTWSYKNAMFGTWAYYVPESMEKQFTAVPPADAEKQRIDAIYKPNIKPDSVVITPRFTSDESDKMAVMATDITKYLDKMEVQFVMNGNVEAGWNDYIAQLKKMGLDEYVQIWQTAYDRDHKK